MNDKYKNWLVSLDSDNFSMYIKTWFAFLASVHELVLLKATPADREKLLQQKGDKPFLEAYRPELNNIQLTDNAKQNIIDAFECSKDTVRSDYPEYYFQTYFKKIVEYKAILQEYAYIGSNKCVFDVSVKKEAVHVGIRIVDGPLLTHLREQFIQKNIKFICHEKFNDIIDQGELFYHVLKYSLRDLLYESILNECSLDEHDKTTLQLDMLLNYIGKRLQDETLHQNIFKIWCDKDSLVERDLKEWFFDFCYALRNVMFHRIIDPFDSRWSSIMKYCYQGLRELLLENIRLLSEHEATSKGSNNV